MGFRTNTNLRIFIWAKMVLRKYIILFLFFFSATAFSQRSEKLKELMNDMETEKNDTLKVKKMILLSEYLFKSDFAQALKYSEEGMRLASQYNRTDLQISALNSFADLYWYSADYDKSFSYYFRAYQLADSIHDKLEVSRSLYNLGWLSCIEQKNYKDIGYLYRSLQLAKELKHVGAQMRVFNALGTCYSSMFKNQKDTRNFDSAVHYYNAGIELGRKSKEEMVNVSSYYVNLCDLYFGIGEFYTARGYANQAMDYYRSLDDSVDVVYVIYKMAQCDFEFGKHEEALRIYKSSYDFFVKQGYKEAEIEALQSLASGHYRVKNYKEAYDYYDMYFKLKKEIDDRSYSTTLKGMENSNSLDRAKANVLQLQQSNEIEELKNKRKTIYISILALIGLVIIVVAYLLFRQNKLRQLTNLKLQEQNKIIIEKKVEIEQSIEYAKGIQTAFLPSAEELKLILKDNFILYKPKDVVSGDFYWYIQTDNGILLACADCTGHGVPGALMSMVGINTLQQLCVERKIQNPGLILKYLNAEIKNSLKQNNDQSTQRDGMDIVLIHLDHTMRKLTYAGANRPLYVIRNNEVKEYKATKHAIGGFTKYDQNFEETKIELEGGDFICLSTDGYADQFGGPHGKKLMTKKLKEFLAEVGFLSAYEQKTKLEEAFNNWKGMQAQVDDVCLIGLKV